MRDVLRRALTLAGIGILIGSGVAWGLTRVLASLLVGVSPHDPIIRGGRGGVRGGGVGGGECAGVADDAGESGGGVGGKLRGRRRQSMWRPVTTGAVSVRDRVQQVWQAADVFEEVGWVGCLQDGAE